MKIQSQQEQKLCNHFLKITFSMLKSIDKYLVFVILNKLF